MNGATAPLRSPRYRSLKAARVNIFEISGTHKYLSEGTFSINVSLLERPSGQVLAKSGDLVSGDPSLVAELGAG